MIVNTFLDTSPKNINLLKNKNNKYIIRIPKDSLFKEEIWSVEDVQITDEYVDSILITTKTTNNICSTFLLNRGNIVECFDKNHILRFMEREKCDANDDDEEYDEYPDEYRYREDDNAYADEYSEDDQYGGMRGGDGDHFIVQKYWIASNTDPTHTVIFHIRNFTTEFTKKIQLIKEDELSVRNLALSSILRGTPAQKQTLGYVGVNKLIRSFLGGKSRRVKRHAHARYKKTRKYKHKC
jgi:hypothetical protein